MDNFVNQSAGFLIALLEQDLAIEQLSPQHYAFFSSYDGLLQTLEFALLLPSKQSKHWGERLTDYLELALIEAPIGRVSNAALKTQIAELSFACLTDPTIERDPDFCMKIVALIRNNRFMVPEGALQAMRADLPTTAAQAAEFEHRLAKFSAAINKAIVQEGIDSAPKFLSFITGEFLLLPQSIIHGIFTDLKRYPWAVEALLLLSAHYEPLIAEPAAEVLNALPEKNWKTLTNTSYIPLLRRFGSSEVQRHLSHWQKLSMKHGSAPKLGQVEQLYASYVDGSHAYMFSGLLREGRRHHLFGGVLRIGGGVVDAYLQEDIEPAMFEEMTISMIQEVKAQACDPQLLRHLLPWILQQLNHVDDPLSADALAVLTRLPLAWSEPQPFDLEKIRIACGVKPLNDNDLKSLRLISHWLQNIPNINTWLIPDLDPKLTKPRQVRDHYYLANAQIYMESLAVNALVNHFCLHRNEVDPWANGAEMLLGCAYVLQQGDLGLKTFPLFDYLAELSLEQREYATSMACVDQPATGYVIKVGLLDSRPAVWRRLTLSSGTTLAEFHHILQYVMGWQDTHLYLYQTRLGHLDEKSGLEQIPLHAVLRQVDDTIGYLYDFGDDWQHEITLEKIQKNDCYLPKVTAGRGACPPEDCGGIWGYNQLLKLTRRAKLTEEEQEQLEHYGMDEGWDPAAFDKTELKFEP